MGRPIAWLVDTFRTPPFGSSAREAAGKLLLLLQRGQTIALPHARPMPVIGPRVLELRVRDGAAKATWRIICRTDPDAVIVVEWFDKDTNQTPQHVLHTCRDRLRRYDEGEGK
jgi:phage-related protein